MCLSKRLAVRVRSLTLAGVLLLAAAALPMAASAHFIGNSWFYNGDSILPLKYVNNAGGFPTYASAIDQGANNWYDTQTPSDLDAYLVGSPVVQADTIASLGGAWGITHVWADYFVCIPMLFCYLDTGEIPFQACSSPCALGASWGNYNLATITLARDTLDLETQFIREKVATHELGHAQGLGHPVSPSCTGVMQQGYVAFNKPQPHDVYDFNLLYPNAWYPLNPAC